MEKFTNINIQYEENIFYLKLVLNNLKKVPLLNINKELFQKKVKEDLTFNYKCSKILYERLLKNNKLITRNKLLNDILNLKTLYNSTVEELIKSDFIKLKEYKSTLVNNREEIENIITLLAHQNKNDYKEDLTTNEELNILFMDDDEKDI